MPRRLTVSLCRRRLTNLGWYDEAGMLVVEIGPLVIEIYHGDYVTF